MINDYKTPYNGASSLINDLIELSRSGDYVFRGVSESYQLEPSIKRYYLNEEYRDLSRSENQLLFDFYRNSSSYLEGNLDLIDFVAYAQHYGLPTRLVDWTRDPFVALYFAINKVEKENQTVKIFYSDLKDNTLINRANFGFSNGQLEDGTEFIEDYDYFIRKLSNGSLENDLRRRNGKLESINVFDNTHYKHDALIFYECKLSNDRLIAQQGLFSIPKSIYGNDASLEIRDNSKFIEITLKKRELDKVKKFLKNMNYTSLRLFPDLQSICEYIVKDTFEKDSNVEKEIFKK